MPLVFALDAGTTGVRAIAFDLAGQPRASAYREFPQHFPRPGWVEHDPNEIWDAAATVLVEVAAAVDEPPVALGITNQRETVVAWDRRTGEPVHRAIVWQDRRTAARCDELAEAHLDLVRTRTGLVPDPYFSGTKLEWLFREADVRPGPDLAVGTVDSWLLWNLTGGAVHATDVSNASRTLLFDIAARAWCPELCDLLGVPETVLPEVRPSSGDFGVVAPGVAGLLAGTPITGVAGDQQAALFGQACLEPGMTKNTYGTGSFVLMHVGSTVPPLVDGLLTTVAWTVPTADGPRTDYAYEGAIFVTGAAVQWLRDGLGIIGAASEVGPLAASVPDSGGVVLVPAFTGLGSPWWDPYARGTVVGITRGTGRAHLARAVVDAMVHQTRDVVDAMVAASGHPLRALRVDGGASAMDLLLQLQADQLGVPVQRPTCQETTALGAAFLAGLAVGTWASIEEIAAGWRLEREVRPSAEAADVERDHATWRRALNGRGWALSD